MKGALPKPTLLELDEYDIKQRVIEALTTTCSHAILFSTVNVEKDAVRIANELQISISTVYKTLTNLEKLSLIEIQRFNISDEGKKIKMYRSRIKKQIYLLIKMNLKFYYTQINIKIIRFGLVARKSCGMSHIMSKFMQKLIVNADSP